MVEPDLLAVGGAAIGLLRRVIGDGIELVWSPSDARLPVRIDPVQLHQVLTNLVVNARDAMGDTGRVTIETARGTAIAPRTLALMHGASYHGNGGRALHALADHYDAELSAAMLARAA